MVFATDYTHTPVTVDKLAAAALWLRHISFCSYFAFLAMITRQDASNAGRRRAATNASLERFRMMLDDISGPRRRRAASGLHMGGEVASRPSGLMIRTHDRRRHEIRARECRAGVDFQLCRQLFAH